MKKPFDTATKDHPVLGRLFQFELDWLDSLGNAADCITHKDLALYASGFRNGISSRTPGPATRAMIEWIRTSNRELSLGPPADLTKTFFAEWPDPASPTPEQPTSSPWTCRVCGEPVRIASDLMPRHLRDDITRTHAAELSDEDTKILADGLRMSD